MAALTDHAENLLLNFLMTTGTATRPTNWYVALYTSAPNDASTGSSGGTEVSGNGYSRQSVSWAAASGTGGTTSNSGVVTFTASGGSFGTVTHLAIADASSGGNLLWHGAMTSSKAVADGDSLQFAVGAIDLTIA
jgi:hypothetical protein